MARLPWLGLQSDILAAALLLHYILKLDFCSGVIVAGFTLLNRVYSNSSFDIVFCGLTFAFRAYSSNCCPLTLYYFVYRALYQQFL